jgi:hypothetical protein
VADAFLDCGDLRYGFARIRCENPDWRHEMLLAFSCPAVDSAPCPRPITGSSCCSSVIS